MPEMEAGDFLDEVKDSKNKKRKDNRTMKKMRKLFAVVCMLAMVSSMTACGSVDDERENTPSSNTESLDNSEENSTSSEESDTPSNGEMEATTQGNGETLVVYFSYSGNTEEVANQIADYTGASLAQIERAEPYTNVNEEGEEELNNEARPEITVDVDDIENYKTVFIGYPIWWDEAPMVIDTFLESYDFAGKTIVPFCTSASDSIDNSLHIFGELAPDAKIADGLTANNSADIEPWLDSLGYGE